MTQEFIKKLVTQTHDYFITSGRTLAIAESCTGGLICNLLTDIPGASIFFKGGIVTYWTESKIDTLGVSQHTINTFGAISSETAIEMAERVRVLFSSDYGLSVTGNLGPSTIEGKEKGLVFIGVSRRGQTGFQRLLLAGERIQNKELAAISALRFLIGAI